MGPRPLLGHAGQAAVALGALLSPRPGCRQLPVGGAQQADGGGGRRDELFRYFSSNRKSKYSRGRSIHLGPLSARSLTAAEGQAGRQRQRLLRRGQADVQAPLVGGESQSPARLTDRRRRRSGCRGTRRAAVAAISPTGLVAPVLVSLWTTVMASQSPPASAALDGRPAAPGWPQGTSNLTACLPQPARPPRASAG